MRDAEKTVGNMIEKLKTAFIGSIDREGFPNIKAMLQPRKREGIKTIYLTTKGGGVPQEERQALTDEQAERLLDAIRDLPPYVFVMIGLYALSLIHI